MSAASGAVLPRAASTGLSGFLALTLLLAIQNGRDRGREPVDEPGPGVVETGDRAGLDLQVSPQAGAALREVALPPPPPPESEPASPDLIIPAAEPRPGQDDRTPAPEAVPSRSERSRPDGRPAREDESPGTEPTIRPEQDTVEHGHILLHLMESGEGPTIDLNWPDGRSARSNLRDVLERCFGMAVVSFDDEGRLAGLIDQRGRTQSLDADRYSRFVRQPLGGDHGATTGSLVEGDATARIFPREFDAVLLGGLEDLLGRTFGPGAHITATYSLGGGELSLRDVASDGRPAEGRIVLGSTRRCAD